MEQNYDGQNIGQTVSHLSSQVCLLINCFHFDFSDMYKCPRITCKMYVYPPVQLVLLYLFVCCVCSHLTPSILGQICTELFSSS
jgi:hypothetical protein